MSFKLVDIGEVLWDLLRAGPQLGGAPANYPLSPVLVTRRKPGTV